MPIRGGGSRPDGGLDGGRRAPGVPEPARSLIACLDRLGDACPECRAVLEDFPRGRIALRAGGSPERWAGRRTDRRAPEPVDDLEAERRRAQPALDALLAGAVEDLMRITISPRFHTWGVGSLLADDAEALLRRGQPREAALSSSLMAAVADRLEPQHYAPGVVAGLRAAARAGLADALLAAEDLDAAEQALHRAESCLRAAPVDHFYEALVALARCRWLLALGEAREAGVRAGALFEEALEERLGDVAVEAMELLAASATQDPEEGRAGLQLLDLLETVRAGGSRTDGAAPAPLRFARGRALIRAGEPEAGLAELDRAADGERGPDHTGEAGLLARWRGAALRALGRTDEAVAELQAARSFLEGGFRPLESLRASLELAGLLLEMGDESSFASTVDGLESALRQRHLPRRAAAVVLSFQERICRLGPDPEAVREATRQLDRLGDAPPVGAAPPGSVH